MFKKIKSVMPMDDYILFVIFTNEESRYYDIKPLFKKWDVFQNLKNITGLYAQVKVDQGGYGVSWNDEIDLSANELWENGTKEVRETV